MKPPVTAPGLFALLGSTRRDRLIDVVRHTSGLASGSRYFHWDELRRRRPPDDLTTEEWWLGLKLARTQNRRHLPLRDADGNRFGYVLTDEAIARIHRIDSFGAGRMALPDEISAAATRDRYAVSMLMDEAIESSLLEGAVTTRRDAKSLLRSGRAPRTRGERMVLNNYRTMQHIRGDLDEPLSVDMILEVHRMVTEGTLDRAEDAGRIQGIDERRVDIGDPADPMVVLHRPPPASQLPKMLGELVDFTNAVNAEPFVHPVVRAIVVHFYLAYIHPFIDGNGRTARALFYRSLLGQGYWLAEFWSISRLLHAAPVKYARSFLHTETDESDVTYFLIHQLDVISRAIDELLEHVTRRTAEVHRVERALRSEPDLNHRQLVLLSHAVRHPEAIYTIESHRASHNIVYQTARTDLLELETRRYLERSKVGRQFRFFPAENLADQVLGE